MIAAEGGDETSKETRLTKGDITPKTVEQVVNLDLSTLTGETRESKVQSYAIETTKQVAAH